MNIAWLTLVLFAFGCGVKGPPLPPVSYRPDQENEVNKTYVFPKPTNSPTDAPGAAR